MSRHALVIGIDTYNDPKLPKLSKATNDAQAIAAILEKYGDCPRNQIKSYYGTINNPDLIKAFRDFLVNQTGERIIYFSGHGISSEEENIALDTIESTGYLAASDTQLKKEEDRFIVTNNSGFKLKDFVYLIKSSKLENLIVIIDACHSGELITELEKSFYGLTNVSNYFFMAACQSWESSWQKESDKYSQFTKALIDALSEEERHKSYGEIDAYTAYKNIEEALAGLGSETSNKGRQKSIHLSKGSSIPLVKYHPTVAELLVNNKPDAPNEQQIEELKAILRQIDYKQIAWTLINSSSYGYQFFESWLERDKNLSSIEEFFITVEKNNLLAKEFTFFLKIISHLANHPKVIQKKELKEWLKPFPDSECATQLEKSDYYLMLVVSQERPEEEFKLNAFLEIAQKGIIPIKVIKKSELYQQNQNSHYLCSCANQWDDQDENNAIGDWIKDAITTSEKLYLEGCPGSYNLNIELFLPFDYLTRKVDLLPINSRKKLGQNYSCLIRYRERLDGKDRNQLERVWQLINAATQSNLLDQIKRLEGIQNYNYASLERELTSEERIGLTCYLPSDEETQEMLYTILDTGIPLALWSRSRDCGCEFEQLLNAPISQLQQLIPIVFEMRKQAYLDRNPESKWGYHLAMLLDNPERIPPSQFLQTPGS